jgi:hypothetical protein
VVNQGLRDANRESDGTGGSATRPKLKKRGDAEDKRSTKEDATNRPDLNGRGTIMRTRGSTHKIMHHEAKRKTRIQESMP